MSATGRVNRIGASRTEKNKVPHTANVRDKLLQPHVWCIALICLFTDVPLWNYYHKFRGVYPKLRYIMAKQRMFVHPSTEMGAEIKRLVEEGHPVKRIAVILGLDHTNLCRAMRKHGYQFYSGYLLPDEDMHIVLRKRRNDKETT